MIPLENSAFVKSRPMRSLPQVVISLLCWSYNQEQHILFFPLALCHITKHIRNSARLFLEEEKAQMTCFTVPDSKNCGEIVYGFRDLYF